MLSYRPIYWAGFVRDPRPEVYHASGLGLDSNVESESEYGSDDVSDDGSDYADRDHELQEAGDAEDGINMVSNDYLEVALPP